MAMNLQYEQSPVTKESMVLRDVPSCHGYWRNPPGCVLGYGWDISLFFYQKMYEMPFGYT